MVILSGFIHQTIDKGCVGRRIKCGHRGGGVGTGGRGAGIRVSCTVGVYFKVYIYIYIGARDLCAKRSDECVMIKQSFAVCYGHIPSCKLRFFFGSRNM